MRKVLLVSIAVVAVASSASPVRAAAYHVHIQGNAYAPQSITVAIGDEITWDNHDQAPHTVTSTGDSGPLASPNMPKNATYSFTFTTPGTYPYYCVVHPWMTAEVVVSGGGTSGVDISPSERDLGVVRMGETSEPATVTVRATGTASVTVDWAFTTMPFHVVRDGCSNVTLAPGEECSVEVVFHPYYDGRVSGPLSISTSAEPEPRRVMLSGAGDEHGPEVYIETADGSTLVSFVDRVKGMVGDDLAGVQGLTLTYTSTLGLPEQGAEATGECFSNDLEGCAWEATPPLIPGVYEVRAVARDRVGNIGPTAGPITVTVI